MKNNPPVVAFVASGFLLLLGSVAEVVASQGSLKLTFAPLWREVLWCSSLSLEAIGLIGALLSVTWWIAAHVKARRRDATAGAASTYLHIMRRSWPIAAGLFLLFAGGFYIAAFEDIPRPFPTPEISATYARRARVASVISLFGAGVLVAGVIRSFRKLEHDTA